MDAATQMQIKANETESQWHPDYTPTLRIEKGRTPSCGSVDECLALRRACVASGRGYFDGKHVWGKTR